ncbi:damaged DNA binding 2 [Actinidia rufa]|uniref:Damaged DNA binding 2 n=1 Tax=Actinidia rufa TaxID=165716 RepID=A0A7J0FT74_9ERIC|nr:damaged DNA binding 2 [Actinidia rufa]
MSSIHTGYQVVITGIGLELVFYYFMLWVSISWWLWLGIPQPGLMESHPFPVVTIQQLDISTLAVEERTGQDFAEIYRNSKQFRFNSTNDGTVYTASSDGTISCTNLETGISMSLMNLNPGGWQGRSSWRMLYGLDVNLEKGLILVADNFGSLYLVDMRSNNKVGKATLIHKKGSKVVGLHYNPVKPDLLLSCGNGHFARIWDMCQLQAGSSLYNLAHGRVVNSARILDMRQLQAGSSLYNLARGRVVNSAHFSPQSGRPVEVSENYNGPDLQPINFIDISTGQLISEVTEPNFTTISPVNKLHPRDDVLASGSLRPKEKSQIVQQKDEMKIIVCGKSEKRLNTASSAGSPCRSSVEAQWLGTSYALGGMIRSVQQAFATVNYCPATANRLPDNKENGRDTTIRCLEAKMVKLRQVLVANNFKIPTSRAGEGSFEVRLVRQKNALRGGLKEKQANSYYTEIESQNDSKIVATGRRKLTAKVAIAIKIILSTRSEIRTAKFTPKDELLPRYQTSFAPEIKGMESPKKFNSPKFTMVFPSSMGDLMLKWFDKLQLGYIRSFLQFFESFVVWFVINTKVSKAYPMGEDPKKRNQRWKCAFQEKKGHKTQNYMALKTFLDYLIQFGHLNEFVDKEKTKEEEAKVRSNPRFDRDKYEADDALEEDLSLGTIHMIGGPNHPDFENRI